jgi:uncharacterized membrane protein
MEDIAAYRGRASNVPTFVRSSAVLVGAANVFLLAASCLWLAATGAEEFERLNATHLLFELCVVAVTGLLAAETVLRLARQALLGSFSSRYASTVLGICFGGAFTVLFPALLAVVVGLAGSPSTAAPAGRR